jgi:hypothetical protein
VKWRGILEERDPTNGGEGVFLEGTLIPVSHVLHSLFVQPSLDELARPGWFIHGEADPSIEELRACVAYALERVLRDELRPVVAAAFLRSLRPRPWRIETSVDEAKMLAEEILPSFADGAVGRVEELRTDRRDVQIAFAYGSAVVRNGRWPRLPDEDETLRDELGERDRALIDELFVYRSELNLVRRTPEIYVEQWRRLVERIERGGYDDDISEHANWLDGRDTLEVASRLVSPGSRPPFDDRLEPLDRRYEAATHPIARSLKGNQVWEPTRWWWFRAPASVGPSLERVFQLMGISTS